MLCTATKRALQALSLARPADSRTPGLGERLVQARLAPGPLAPRSPGPSGTFDVALLSRSDCSVGRLSRNLRSFCRTLLMSPSRPPGPGVGGAAQRQWECGLGQSWHHSWWARRPCPVVTAPLRVSAIRLHPASPHPSTCTRPWLVSRPASWRSLDPKFRCSHFPPREAGLRTRITQSQKAELGASLGGGRAGKSFWDGVRDWLLQQAPGLKTPRQKSLFPYSGQLSFSSIREPMHHHPHTPVSCMGHSGVGVRHPVLPTFSHPDFLYLPGS